MFTTFMSSIVENIIKSTIKHKNEKLELFGSHQHFQINKRHPSVTSTYGLGQPDFNINNLKITNKLSHHYLDFM